MDCLPLFDHHVHLDDESLSAERVMSGLDDPRLVGAVSAGFGPERSHRAREWTLRSPRLWRTVGLHPWWLASRPQDHDAIEAAWDALLSELDDPRVVALGEMGLDQTIKRRMDLSRQRQEFTRALGHCRSRGLPAVIHAVRWPGHALASLQRSPPPGGVMHRYAGPVDMVESYQALGLHLSLDVVRWRRDPETVRAIARAADPRLLLVETDWPLDDRPWRVALDELEALVRDLALTLQRSPMSLARQLVTNAQRLYGVEVTV